MFVEAFDKKYGYKPEWGAENAYMQIRARGRAWSPRPAPSIRRTSSRPYEKGETFNSLVGDVHFRPEDHQCVRPVVIVRGKQPKDMKNKEDYWEVARSRARRAADAEAGRVRLQSRRLHLTHLTLLRVDDAERRFCRVMAGSKARSTFFAAFGPAACKMLGGADARH